MMGIDEFDLAIALPSVTQLTWMQGIEIQTKWSVGQEMKDPHARYPIPAKHQS